MQSHTLLSSDEFDTLKESVQTPLLVQFGSKPCTRCPIFTERIVSMQQSHQFTHVYIDVHEAEEELLSAFNVSQLPAYALIARKEVASKKQSATPDDVQEAIVAHCLPVLTMDDDF